MGEVPNLRCRCLLPGQGLLKGRASAEASAGVCTEPTSPQGRGRMTGRENHDWAGGNVPWHRVPSPSEAASPWGWLQERVLSLC